MTRGNTQQLHTPEIWANKKQIEAKRSWAAGSGRGKPEAILSNYVPQEMKATSPTWRQ
jgi:hypothetical protein